MSALTSRTGETSTGFKSLPSHGQAFIVIVALCGLVVIVESGHDLYISRVTSQWFLLAALTLLSGSITVKLPSIPATISVSETFVFTSVLLFGTAAGTITVTLDGLIISLWLRRRNLELHKLLFNTTAPALSIWISSHIFFWVTGASPLTVTRVGITNLLPGLLIFAVAYFLLNSWLMAAALSIEQRVKALYVWRQNFMWLSLNFVSGASVAILLVTMTKEVNLAALAVIVPLLIVSYLTYHTAMGRVEDANRHVKDLNQLYLSTIETLAMAVDAKDQVTHGHIRRVQSFSVRLARDMGVSDESLIKAIEAASLLHDMGKLAIPEHILNKPGKLTIPEFEIMKAHATVGADILSAIEFPYPVIPIVRHHHENWDGTGYPDGLAGTDIPMGARILAVVDCFDALTSDRPYRARLELFAALNILRDRRGKMYDPLIVDAFIKMQHRSAPYEDVRPEQSAALARISTAVQGIKLRDQSGIAPTD
jgi:putative nucleotidyltransferase with HDIG domain